MDIKVAMASFNGTVVLLILTAAGAFLAHKKVLDEESAGNVAEMHVDVLLPALLYTSILDAVYAARTTPSAQNLSKVIFPPVWGLIVVGVGLVIGWIAVKIIATSKCEGVKRVAISAIAFGNSGNLPLMLLTALCDTFGALQLEDKCVVESASITSLYGISWNIVLWLPVYSYVVSAGDEMKQDDEYLSSRLLEDLTEVRDESEDSNTWSSSLSEIFSPPFLGIFAAFITAFVPLLPEALLDNEGMLASVMSALRQLGNAVVPTSSIVVGARLYSAFLRRRQHEEADIFDEMDEIKQKYSFGFRLHAVIIILRLIVLPFVGRVIYGVLELKRLPSKLVGLIAIIEFAVPTANSMVMLAILSARRWPKVGRRIEEEVATSVMYQYLAVPVILTVNTALALERTYVSDGREST